MRHSIFTVLSLVSLSSLVACSGTPDAPAPLGAPSSGGSVDEPGNATGPGSPDGGSVDPGKPAEPPAPPPKADEITEQYGIFVSTGGAAEAAGTRQAPLASITEAIAKAKASKKRVFVCEGTYEESLQIENGVSIVAGLDCSVPTAWKLSDKHSSLKSPVSPALKATSITSPTRIDNLDIEAPDATEASGSSIGALVVDSNALTFAKGTIKAGVGMKGEDGVEAEQLYVESDRLPGLPVAATPTGANEGHMGGAGAKATCYRPSGAVFSQSTGGLGGYSGLYTFTSGSWIPVRVNGRFEFAAQGENPGAGLSIVEGTAGVSSSGGGYGPSGFTAGDGTAGTSGGAGIPGRGGNGAAPKAASGSGTWWGSSGGGGGAAGCPGLAGTAGKGGGASLGVLAVRSPVRFESMQVVASAGGAGGRGTFGSNSVAGTAGADDTTQVILLDHTTPGSRGGNSGISGNGAGGPSIGIAHVGLAPILTQSNTQSAPGGAGIQARTQGSKTLPASPAGESAGVKAVGT